MRQIINHEEFQQILLLHIVDGQIRIRNSYSGFKITHVQQNGEVLRHLIKTKKLNRQHNVFLRSLFSEMVFCYHNCSNVL